MQDAGNNPVMNVDASGLDFTTGFGGMLYETYNWAIGNSFNWQNVKGAFLDGYNGQGSFSNPYANMAWAATNDLMNFGTLGTGSVLKNTAQLGIKQMENVMQMTKFATPEIKFASFESKAKLEDHFLRHGKEFGRKSMDEYLGLGQSVMNDGYKVQYLYSGEIRNGYLQFMGNNSKGLSKFAFVGTNRDGFITTIHTQSGKDIWRTINGNTADKVIRVRP